jgi:hypothetical protein
MPLQSASRSLQQYAIVRAPLSTLSVGCILCIFNFEILPCVQAIQSQAQEAGQDEELAQALWALGSVLSDQGRWVDALTPLHQSLLLMEALGLSDSLDIASVCNSMTSTVQED